MIIKSACFALSFVGLAGSIAFLATPSVQAQDTVDITGGSGTLDGGTIFVPGAGDSNTLIYESTLPDGTLVIQTNQGNIPAPIIFKEGTVPTLNTTSGSCNCAVPAVGDTGKVDGNVSFRAFDANGQPALFVGVPASLEFSVTSLTPTGPNFNSTRFSTPPDFVLTTTGSASTSGGSVQTSSAIDNVFIFQIQPQGSEKTDQEVLGINVPAAEFTETVDGISYPADLDFDLTGGFVTIPAQIGFSPTGSSNSGGSGGNNPDTNFVSSNTTFIPVFQGDDGATLNNVIYTEYTPTSNRPIPQGSDDTGSGTVYQMGDNYYVTVGLPSRVFPGLIGVTPTQTPSASPNQPPLPGTNQTPSPSPNQPPLPGTNQTPSSSPNQPPLPGTNQTPFPSLPGTNQTPSSSPNQPPLPGTNQTPFPSQPGTNQTPSSSPNRPPIPSPGTNFPSQPGINQTPSSSPNRPPIPSPGTNFPSQPGINQTPSSSPNQPPLPSPARRLPL